MISVHCFHVSDGSLKDQETEVSDVIAILFETVQHCKYIQHAYPQAHGLTYNIFLKIQFHERASLVHVPPTPLNLSPQKLAST